MPLYEWKNEKGEIRTTDSYKTPPDNKHEWQRVFSFGISTISGAGNSPGRTSVK